MKKRLKLMLPFLLILALVTNAVTPELFQPSVVYAAEQPANPQQGTEMPSSIVLGKGTIEINGHLFTDQEFQTFLSNAKIVRIPFETASTFSLEDYDGLVENSTVAAGGLTILANAIIGVFEKISAILDLAGLDGYAYLAIGTIDVVSAAGVVSVALALAIKFLPDAIEINGIHIGSFNTALVDMIGFFSKHKEANPDEVIVNPNPGSGGTTKPGEDTGDVTQPGTATGGSTQPGEDPEGDSKPKLTSSIDKDPRLVKAAEEMGKNERVQQEANHLIDELLKGNENPGLGTKNLFKDVNYLRGRNGARVFYRKIDTGYEILAKADKANEQTVINVLKKLYE